MSSAPLGARFGYTARLATLLRYTSYVSPGERQSPPSFTCPIRLLGDDSFRASWATCFGFGRGCAAIGAATPADPQPERRLPSTAAAAAVEQTTTALEAATKQPCPCCPQGLALPCIRGGVVRHRRAPWLWTQPGSSRSLARKLNACVSSRRERERAPSAPHSLAADRLECIIMYLRTCVQTKSNALRVSRSRLHLRAGCTTTRVKPRVLHNCPVMPR